MERPNKTTDELIKCVRREINLRKVVYKKNVNAGNMSAKEARHELDCMMQILSVLKEKEATLFNQPKDKGNATSS